MTLVPATGAGKRVWQYLIYQNMQHTLLLMVHPVLAPELIYQAWIVAMRRMFAQDANAEAARTFVSAILTRQRHSPVAPDVVKALVDLAMGEAHPLDLRRRDRLLVLPILEESVRTARLSEREVAELVRAAEKRLDRWRRKAGRSRRGMRVSATTGGGNDAGIQPKSVIGQTLRAMAGYDRERVAALPREQSNEAIVAVVNAAFGMAVKKRFNRDQTGEIVAGFAERVVTASQDPLLDRLAVISITEGVLGEDRAVYTESDLELAIQVKVLGFVQAVEELGLYEREIDEIIHSAEQMADAQGINLTSSGGRDE
ncbi:hypothetical protein O7605_11535 [Verrucosispora sp. WMMA2121]|uniref:hypothetical protein n=1 Tax=Verrucosispora sp. WMMA2121 TaxID=3015164 RepID=UPI0022B630AB|nr:hypothetical protein [Verrucosispora sp. WMMA2121]MCZ7420145.1 hypothetical protein [Verrucosispora sp. WMMA2121]